MFFRAIKIINPVKAWREGELIKTFKLNRIVTEQTPRMKEWLNVAIPTLNIGEHYIFEEDLVNAQKHITGWNEEDLKMKTMVIRHHGRQKLLYIKSIRFGR